MLRYTLCMLVLLSVALISACAENYKPKRDSQTKAGQAANDPSETSPAKQPAPNGDAAEPVRECFIQITETLETVHDEASARAAAPKLTGLTDRLKPAFEKMMSGIALALTTGAPLPTVMNKDHSDDLFAEMQSEIVRVYHTPAGQFIHAELRRLLDTLVECTIYAERERIQKWIQREKLDQ